MYDDAMMSTLTAEHEPTIGGRLRHWIPGDVVIFGKYNYKKEKKMAKYFLKAS